ncbi:hypothetical protein BX611_2661 [Lutibacter oceani]|uniref:Uncharacterized protein n=1 Tax=Lutibacter oceani TaxID=1853311 RepID=A0A3D9RSR2_9FLAO|nr:hypothetical protein [Lutibacter oceani]REE79765.1 hypothetical protein BX611_2661 [Lutibacter oceani]
MIKNTKKSSLLLGSFMIILIVFIPYLLYVHKFIDQDLEKFETIFGTIKGGSVFTYAQVYIYMLLSKLVPLLLLIIWFITNKHWWVHALAIPISVYLFQLISVINDSEEYVDDVEFIYTVPIAVLVMVILYYLRSKMSIYIQAVDLKKEMDENMKIPTKID